MRSSIEEGAFLEPIDLIDGNRLSLDLFVLLLLRSPLFDV